MRTVFFIPPLSRLSGGLRNIYDTIQGLDGLGYELAVASPGNAQGLEELLASLNGRVPRLSWNSSFLEPSDLWVIPESWPNAVAPGARSGARTVVYAQSWSLMLTCLPVGVRWKSLPVSYMAVSHPVAWFLKTLLEVPVLGLLPPCVDPVFFLAREESGAEPAPARRSGNRPVRVAWMPRKNKALAEQVQLLCAELLARDGSPPPLEWVSLYNLSLEETARGMASCHLFLATAFPEGFGLPPLEAMAAGCVPVGFSGMGGWEYMRQAQFSGRQALPGSAGREPYGPLFPLPEKPWGGNGCFVADGDVLAAAFALASLVRLAHQGGEEWNALRRNGLATALQYSAQARQPVLAELWAGLCNT